MNPHDELNSLISMFAGADELIAAAEHIPSSETPEPFKQLLVHDHHMTVTMESFHGDQVCVEILESRHTGDSYARQIVLRLQETNRVVQFGIVRFNLEYVTPTVRQEILAGQVPLGRVLINHNVLRHIDLGAVMRIVAGDHLSRALQTPVGTVTYGRLATIFCNRVPAVDLLEIAAPVSQEVTDQRISPDLRRDNC